MTEQHVVKAQVARQRIGGLGGEQQREQAEHTDADRARQWWPRQQDDPSQHAGQQPGDQHPRQRLDVEAGKLQQGQRVGDARRPAEPVQPAEHVQPAVARQLREDDRQHGPEHDHRTACQATSGPARKGFFLRYRNYRVGHRFEITGTLCA